MQASSIVLLDAAPFLLFRLRGHLCGLPLQHVVETMRPLPIEGIAGAPAVVRGLSVIRGVPLPVLDLGAMLDGEEVPPTRFVTLRIGVRHVALAVEAVVGLRYLSADVMKAVPPLLKDAGETLVSTIATRDAELLLVLNSAHLVPESVWTAIDASGETSPL